MRTPSVPMTSIFEAAERSSLDIRYFLEDPDPILSTVCEPVRDEEFGADAIKVSQMMIDAMRRGKNGVGLAAPQVGLLKRMFVMTIPSKEPLVVFNPEIHYVGERTVLGDEGCLSVPGVYNQVKRYPEIQLTYRDSEAKVHFIQLYDFLARVAQHEYDHLDGIMFFDRLAETRMRRRTLKVWADEREKLGIRKEV